jgi:hypothetical protein
MTPERGSLTQSADLITAALIDLCTLQVVVEAVVTLVVGVVLVESSTRPTTQSHLAQPTPLLSAKGEEGPLARMVVMEVTPLSLVLAHRQS